MTQKYDSVLKLDIEEIQKHAEHSIKEGAVTDDYPLNLEDACRVLNSALATEIVCVLRYRHHEIIAKGIDSIQVANEFKEHAEQEEQHMLMLAERINQLGGDPDLNPATVNSRAIAEYGNAKTLQEMIKANLIAERIVITFYRKMIEWFEHDSTTRKMLEKILKQEEEHANDLADLLG